MKTGVMKGMKRRIAVLLLLLFVFSAVVPQMNPAIVAEAHSGRTDSSGGHKDNKNKSGLGSYHYHCGGHEAHLHQNGVCPYNSTVSTGKRAVPETKAAETQPRETKPVETQPAQVNSGWQKDDTGWWYLNADSTYPKAAWKEIDKKWYYFGEDGYLLVNTTTPDGNRVDENGAMISS